MAPRTFGERLAAEMERRGWDQKMLAQAVGLSESAISRHLEKEEAPRADSLKKYADALEVSVGWLGYGRMDPPPAASSGPAAPARLMGEAALDLVLRDYVYPADADMVAIDAAEEEARQAAQTSAGHRRSPAAWRAYLDRLIKRKSDRRNVTRLEAERRRGAHALAGVVEWRAASARALRVGRAA